MGAIIKDGLTLKEFNFCRYWLEMGGNGVQAYMLAYPNKPYATAKTDASQLLSNPNVRKYLQKQLERTEAKHLASREALILETQEFLDVAKANGNIQQGLQAINLKAKLNRIYSKDDGGGEGYKKLIQALQVNVNVGDKGLSTTEVKSIVGDTNNNTETIDTKVVE